MTSGLPEVGKTYRVRHRRLGELILRVDTVDDCWVTGWLVSSTLGLSCETVEILRHQCGEFLEVGR